MFDTGQCNDEYKNYTLNPVVFRIHRLAFMCLGIPMQIKSINGYSAVCEARGIERDASLLMMMDQDLRIGDFVMISVGNIISKIDEQEAMQAWALYDEMFEIIDTQT